MFSPSRTTFGDAEAAAGRAAAGAAIFTLCTAVAVGEDALAVGGAHLAAARAAHVAGVATAVCLADSLAAAVVAGRAIFTAAAELEALLPGL